MLRLPTPLVFPMARPISSYVRPLSLAARHILSRMVEGFGYFVLGIGRVYDRAIGKINSPSVTSRFVLQCSVTYVGPALRRSPARCRILLRRRAPLLEMGGALSVGRRCPRSDRHVSRRKPSQADEQRHDFDCAFPHFGQRPVELTAAANNSRSDQAGDATSCVLPTAEFASLAIPSAGCNIVVVIFLKARRDGPSYLEHRNLCYRRPLRRVGPLEFLSGQERLLVGSHRLLFLLGGFTFRGGFDCQWAFLGLLVSGDPVLRSLPRDRPSCRSSSVLGRRRMGDWG